MPCFHHILPKSVYLTDTCVFSGRLVFTWLYWTFQRIIQSYLCQHLIYLILIYCLVMLLVLLGEQNKCVCSVRLEGKFRFLFAFIYLQKFLKTCCQRRVRDWSPIKGIINSLKTVQIDRPLLIHASQICLPAWGFPEEHQQGTALTRFQSYGICVSWLQPNTPAGVSSSFPAGCIRLQEAVSNCTG